METEESAVSTLADSLLCFANVDSSFVHAQIPERTLHVLSYFLRNPHTADTLEGMARWRLRGEMVRRSVEDADAALRCLVQWGFLCERKVAGGEPLFFLNQAKAEEAAQMVGARTHREFLELDRSAGADRADSNLTRAFR